MSGLAVGGPHPPGIAGGGGWDFWILVGFVSLTLLLLTDSRRLPVWLVVSAAVVGGLILSALTRTWGVVPVWGGLLIVALGRNLRRWRGRPQV